MNGICYKEENDMKSFRRELTLTLPRRRAFVNITPQVEEALAESGIREGLLLCNAMHITASVFINDDESGLHSDFETWLEKLAPEKADKYTMGNSCLIQARETDHEVKFVAPDFAYKFTREELENRLPQEKTELMLEHQNFWWIELGGDRDALGDAETLNKELLARAYGVWDFIKNSGYYDCRNWELEWIGFLAGKRETRRYVGDYTLTENDIVASKEFYDAAAYGGWGLDDHNPYGMNGDYPNREDKFDKPYDIPYRCLYSENVKNLFFAGRNISVTHMALSSTRVMATCGMLGQAVGAACGIAKKYSTDPRGVLEHIDELQRLLRDDDCYLLHCGRKVSDALRGAEFNVSENCAKRLFGTHERTLNGENPPLELPCGYELKAEFEPVHCDAVRVVFDSDLLRKSYDEKGMWTYGQFPSRCNVPLNAPRAFVPPTLVKEYEIRVKTDGKWESVQKVSDNRKRLVFAPVNKRISGISLECKKTHGDEYARVFSIDII